MMTVVRICTARGRGRYGAGFRASNDPTEAQTVAQQLTTSPERGVQRLKMTYEEFLAWADEDVRAEWVDGEVIVYMPPKEIHQEVVTFLLALLRFFVGRRRLGKVWTAPYEMHLATVRASREPDILFVAREHYDRRTPERLEGPADLAVEILSESTASYVRRVKVPEYERAGVRECWLIDLREGQRSFEPYALGSDGRYCLLTPDSAGRFHSIVLPGFWLDPGWLWQDPLPEPEDVLMEIDPEGTLNKLAAVQERLRRQGQQPTS